MIGQQKAKTLLSRLCNIPQFIIVSGPTGSGKTLFIQELCKSRLDCEPIEVFSIDDIRNICGTAVNIQSPKAYILSSFDTINFRAKEAILKLCEEVPPYIYIFIETKSLANVKQTLLSRAFIFELEPYSKTDLQRYCLTLTNLTEVESESLVSVFKTPGQILRASQLGVQAFIGYCSKVTSFVCTAPLGNAMKISNSLNLKSTDTGYDLDLFFECVAQQALVNWRTIGLDSAYKIIFACSKTRQQLAQTTSLNKQMLFDSWLLTIRGMIQ